MTTRTKNALGRIIGYTMLGTFVFLIFSMVIVSKSIYRNHDAWMADRQTIKAEGLIHRVDVSVDLCENLSRIPYPLNFYIELEAYDLRHLR